MKWKQWKPKSRVINPLDELGVVQKRLDGVCVVVEYDNGKTGIAYDSALRKPFPEEDCRISFPMDTAEQTSSIPCYGFPDFNSDDAAHSQTKGD